MTIFHYTGQVELVKTANMVAETMNAIAEMNADHEEFSPIQVTNMEGLLLVWRNCCYQLAGLGVSVEEIAKIVTVPNY